jgi:hypothetical protein
MATLYATGVPFKPVTRIVIFWVYYRCFQRYIAFLQSTDGSLPFLAVRLAVWVFFWICVCSQTRLFSALLGLFSPEDGYITLLRNIGNYLLAYTEKYPRRLTAWSFVCCMICIENKFASRCYRDTNYMNARFSRETNSLVSREIPRLLFEH